MSKIIVVRHGESIANTKGIYQGQTYDTALSELGKRQAASLGHVLTFKGATLQGDKIDRIIASPLKRTMQTAKAISDLLDLPIEKEELITETNHGLWEGKKKEWIKKHYPKIWKTWNTKPSLAEFPNGEKFTETVDRVRKFLLNSKWEGTSLVVSHDNIVRVMVCLANDDSIDNMWNFEIEPAAINVFEIAKLNGSKKIDLLSLNELDHLKGIRADISQHAL